MHLARTHMSSVHFTKVGAGDAINSTAGLRMTAGVEEFRPEWRPHGLRNQKHLA